MLHTLCKFRDWGPSGSVVTSFFTFNSLTNERLTNCVSFKPGTPLDGAHSMFY